MPFSGIPIAALDFYEDLENDNSKAFWQANKHVYEESVRTPLSELAAELASEFGPAKLFRPYRDVRFSKDKTPYKTHQGAYFAESHRYLHVSAAGLLVGGGYYHLESAQIARLRRALDDDMTSSDLVTALQRGRRAGLELGGEKLTRVPAGYPKDHPRADLLRHKSLTLLRELGCPPWLGTARAKAEVVKSWRAMDPLISWLDSHVGAP
jgi:uncharacterized protein (TIGR02453 family)